MATEQIAPKSHPMRIGVPLILSLFAIGGVVAYFGTRGNRSINGALRQPGSPDEALTQSGSPVVSMVMPHDEPALPPGPNREQVQITCSTCHSTRLVLTQPAFPKSKWEATVKKMVDAYGAPLSADDQAKAADYLIAVRGQ